MTIKLTSRMAARLRASARLEIERACHRAREEIETKRVAPSQHETRFVAHLCRAMTDVAKEWDGQLISAKTGLRVGLTAVFTHQSPYVKWVPRKRCELADVLIAFIDRTASASKCNAVLIQAKLSDTPSIKLSSASEKKQFELFTTRPIFGVDVSGAPKDIDLTQLTPDSALLYGSASLNYEPWQYESLWPYYFLSLPNWLTADDLKLFAGSNQVICTDHLANTLVGMLLGDYGWPFDLPLKPGGWQTFHNRPNDDWSILINYLLEETLNKPLPIALREAAGTITRGTSLYLAAKNSTGLNMFCTTYQLLSSKVTQQFAGPSESGSGEWRIVDENDFELSADGHGSGGDGERRISDEMPESGQLSVILFEIGGE